MIYLFNKLFTESVYDFKSTEMENRVMVNDDDRMIPWPWSVKTIPNSIKDLIGRKVRIVSSGDAVTMEYQPGRVTIYVTEDKRINDIQIESDKPLERI